MRFFWLYRVPADRYRAQTIQVLHAAHAMASRGHEVWVPVDRGGRSEGRDLFELMGLEPRPGLRLIPLNRNPVGSWQFRAALWRWSMRPGDRGVVVARSKRHAASAARWLGRRFDLFMEFHEVDSELARERHEDPNDWRELEGRVLKAARGVFTNAEGTLSCLRAAWPDWDGPARVVHNATRAERCRSPRGEGEGYGGMGSVLPEKGLETVADAAKDAPHPINVIGPRSRWHEDLQARSNGRLILEDPVPYLEVPDRLARFRAVILPLGTGLFGRSLTSPLKLWDYAVCGRPVVAADTPAIRDAMPGHDLLYRPGDAASLLSALEEAERRRCPVPHRLRTWDERALEMESFIEEHRS